ncbi:putative reverse transcriptase zinc-binding domain-containing protein [Rosa chinensis]|uniref:Putative reverse transcriptase zinc-binding domain-containing protein n=1 Tax=Rosa chinensis TaxID=74649 RepID=A0A2P6RYF5_ROSCH|nr:putative reverse transcriptase zinc-binding domain-containing protein [Rosa chinensis]
MFLPRLPMGILMLHFGKLSHNLLPTRTALTSKGYSGDLNCCVCSESVETLEHLFRDCSIAKDILGAPPFSLPSSPLTWKEWLLDRASNLSTSLFDKLLVLLWSFWKNRNEKLWKNQSQTSPRLVASSMAWYEEYLQANKPCTIATSVQQKASKLWLALG